MSEIETRGDDYLFRTFMAPGDALLLRRLQKLAFNMTEPELRRFCEGNMNALVVVQDAYRKMFPEAYAVWDAAFNAATPGAAPEGDR